MSEPQTGRDDPKPPSDLPGPLEAETPITAAPGDTDLAGTVEFALGATSEPTDDAPTIISKGMRKTQRPDEIVTNTLRGKKLAHFELIEQIGVGGMAAVISAHDTQLDRNVALKILPPSLAADPESLRRFQHEAKAAARLDHENIARVFYCGSDQGLHFIAFEFVEGENLRIVIDKRGRLPVGESIKYMLQVATGLAHAASRGVVHRDIKPSNIIITPTGKAKLVDMGLARSLGGKLDGSLTQSGVTLGTFDYISPEQALEPRDADVRSDIYSLGCTFYHCLTGQPPVPEGTAARKLHHHQHVAPVDPRQINPTIPDDVAAVLARMMAKDPKQRYQQPELLVQHLLHLAQKSGGADVPEGMVYADAPLPEPPQSRPLVVALSAAMVLVGLIVLIGMLPSTSSNPDFNPGNVQVKPKPQQKPGGPEHTAPDSTAKTIPIKPDIQPPPQVAKPVTVQSGKEIADAAKAGSSHILLADRIQDFKLKREEGEVPGIVFAGKDLVIESADASRRPTIHLKYDTGGKDQPWSALTVKSGQVTLRNLRIEIDAAGTDTPMSAVARMGGRIKFERCEFIQSGFPPDEPETAQLSSIQVAGRANEGDDGLPDLVFDRCYFRGGHQAMLFTGLANVQMKNCAFGPYNSVFHFRGSGEAELALDHCSTMLNEPSSVFLFTDGAAAKLVVNHSLFSAPVGGGMEAENGVVLVKQIGDGSGRVQYETSSKNIYHNVRTFWQQGPKAAAATLDNFRLIARTGRNDSSIVLTTNPWQMEKPLGSLAEPEKSFQASQELSELRQIDNPRSRMIGVEQCAWGSVYPLVLRPLKERFVDPTANNSTPGVYRTLTQAINDAQPGDVILIRTNKEVTVQPIRLEDFPNVDLTIKPDQGFRPILKLGSTTDTDPAMFRLTDGRLTLENLEIELPPPQAGQNAQSLVYFGGDGQCICKKCLFSFTESVQGPVPRSVFTLADPTKVMRKDPKPNGSGPKLVLKDGCFIRGEASVLHVRGSQAFTLDVDDTLAVLDGSFVTVDGSPMEPPTNPPAKVSLARVTAYLSEHLLLLRACERKEMAGLVPTQVLQVSSCLFVSSKDKNSFIHLDGMDSDEQMRKLFTWGDGKENVYSNFAPMLEQKARPTNMMPLAQIDKAKWEEITSRETDRRFVERIVFNGWPASPERALSRATPGLFRIKLPADLPACGADLDRLVRPRPEVINGPPPGED
jgi:serine/threonine protein kinase